jgi:ribA/ribD-fused uncharacterized protein
MNFSTCLAGRGSATHLFSFDAQSIRATIQDKRIETNVAIYFFSKSDTHREFSNFAAFPIELDGLRWPTTEHYYQAQKFTDEELRQKIRKAEKPIIAKKLAEKHRANIRPDWDAVKDDVMYRAVKCKFEAHAELRDLLLATGQEDIVEAAPTDYYWGVGREGTGQNKLGKIIERIRAELRAGGAGG